jgi:hypothetical protein
MAPIDIMVVPTSTDLRRPIISPTHAAVMAPKKHPT